jgi:ketosteroid isomerase-like protein
MDDRLTIARNYLSALEGDIGTDELAAFFADDVVQIEYPNRLTPNGAQRDLATLLEGHERGSQLMAGQRYEIKNALQCGETVVLEVDWTGTLGIDAGSLAAGDEMHAHFAVFLEFRDGKIVRQRNYDCFEPW